MTPDGRELWGECRGRTWADTLGDLRCAARCARPAVGRTLRWFPSSGTEPAVPMTLLATLHKGLAAAAVLLVSVVNATWAGSPGRDWDHRASMRRRPLAHFGFVEWRSRRREYWRAMGGRPGGYPVVGRDDELGVFQRAVARATEGQPGVVLVSGDPGIGKSTLLSEAARRADTQLFLGRCVHVGGDAIPLAPLVDLIRQVQRGSEVGQLPSLESLSELATSAQGAPATCSS